MSRPAGVTAAAIVAIIGSAITLLLAIALAFVAFVVAPNQLTAMPGFHGARIAAAIITFVLAGVGLLTGIGVLRLRRWARTSMLVFAALTAPIFFFLTVAVTMVPLGPMPGAPEGVEAMVRVVAVALYAIPFAVSVWWLYQFSSQGTKAAFLGEAPADPRPLVVFIVGWGNILGGIVCLLPVVLGTPAFIAGAVVHGLGARVFYLIFGAVSLYLGWGLLRLQERARVGTLALFALMGAQTVYATLSPNARARMLEMQTELGAGRAAMPEFDMTAFLVTTTIATVVLLAAGAFFLIRARPAFESDAGATPGTAA